MDLLVNKRGDSAVAIARGAEPVITNVQDALDLMASARYLHSTGKLLLPKQVISEDFFDLRTGLAGEILQKYTNYGVRVAIVGDFSGYGSRALRDFIRESNRGGRVYFLLDEEQALDALHGAPDSI